ncbi:MAG TPA: DUF4350 domain-containing protein [Blastocatellia bacterium]|jgi:hypothetical protein|nr:DUF4350 domain-containing protein [Blastocatellia bacterium]
MRRYIGVTITIIVLIFALIAMTTAGNIDFDRPAENEYLPNRSTYNSGPTGTRALYQLLEESGTPVSRWRRRYSQLNAEAKGAILVIIGPFSHGLKTSEEENFGLQAWIAAGGQALIISRSPLEQFPGPAIRSKPSDRSPGFDATPEEFIDEESDELIAQPTELTLGVRGLALTEFASRMSFHSQEKAREEPQGEAQDGAQDEGGEAEEEAATNDVETPAGASDVKSEDEKYSAPSLRAPVIHLGDKDGAALADFKYGEGRVIILSDPFVVANNGVARGGNLRLAMNIMRSMGAPGRRVLFDEFHHGYHDEGNPLVNYFRGTPAPWLLLQGFGLSLLIVYTYSRRFARPMPLPQIDRHSPLEFVGSMANLQQAARARELALENIYPRFKAGLCRRLGLSSRASRDSIVAAARRRRLPISEIELRQTLSDAEMALAGELIDDARLLTLVSRMRRIISQTAPRA